jgi:hypothetical protein
VGPTADSNNANLLFGQPIHVTGAGALQSISFYVTIASGTFRVGLYDNSGANGPGNLLAQSGDITAVAGWDIVPMPAVALKPGTYWEYILPSSSILAFAKLPYTGDKNPYVTYPYGPLPNSFPATTTFSQSEWSFSTTVLTPGGTTSAATTTTPTPTTTTPTTTITAPTTTTTPSVTCFQSPGSCGYPDPAYGNVGVPSGTNLTPSGPLDITTNGTVINGLSITSGGAADGIDVNADNVTIENTLITMTGGGCGPPYNTSNLNCPYGVLIDTPSGGCVSLVNDTITTDATTTLGQSVRVINGCVNMSKVEAVGNNDELCACYSQTTPNTISDSYSLVDLYISTDHVDNIYTSSGSVTVTHSTLINLDAQTANLLADNPANTPCTNHIVMKNNLLIGGGYNIYPCANASSVGTSTLDFENNLLPRCSGYANGVVTGWGGLICPGATHYCPSWVPGAGPSGQCPTFMAQYEYPTGSDANGWYARDGSFGSHADTYCSPPSQVTWANNTYIDGATIIC